jgi:alanyl-tRNA synthetase
MTKYLTTSEIRKSFIEFFESKGHTHLPSAPLIPHNDPTLMFINAGMVQFKNIFNGLEDLKDKQGKDITKVVTSQKCVRAGGKHNDLDNVGYTKRHHTFFEMLGNFSFGEYFKEDAIKYAWEYLTETLGLPKDKLLVTVYHTDDEAYKIWQNISGLPDDKILRIATSDNFWSMGDEGPCGPCSEIFYDHGEEVSGGPPGSDDEDGDRFVEIWNLVFMQYDKQKDGEMKPLPNPCIDTGMGLERMATVMQGIFDNFETDLFEKLIIESQQRSGKTDSQYKTSHKIITDHLRSTCFLIADGVLPSNEGRGYVLRRIMRRAMRHCHNISPKEIFMHKIVDKLISLMGDTYPELAEAKNLIIETITNEEKRFRETLENGLKLLNKELETISKGQEFSGDTAFKLYDTYGFPYDLTEDILREKNITINKDQFDQAMSKQKEMAKASWSGSGESASEDLWFDLHKKYGDTEFLGYEQTESNSQITEIIQNGVGVDDINASSPEKQAIIITQAN